MKLFKTIALSFIATAVSYTSFAQTVDAWVTNGDQSALLQKQAATSFSNSNLGSTITINPATTFQSIDGFGFCLTEGSCEVISSLPVNQQNDLLNEFFNPTTGMGNDVVRISIGASDLSSSSYSYCESNDLNNFSLAGPDLTYVIPMLKRILAINPNIKILATPWSAPRWMKTNNAWIGGELWGSCYQPYANYFVKYLDAMKAQGINIWAVSVQNEPENPYNEPSMLMTADAELWFIDNHLGPTLRAAGYQTKIIGYDHNADNTAYPIKVAGSAYVDGSAFHLYAGNISALTTVKNATNKNIYFTEQYTDKNGGFSGDFSWHTQNVTIGSMNNWSRTTFEWNLANDQNFNPRTPGGCTSCKGAITVNNGTSYTRNVAYYIIAQFSKFVKTGATRIGSTCSDGAFSQVAFKNTDGSYALVVYNNSGGKNFTVGIGGKSFTTYVPGYSAITLKWADIVPTTDVVTVYKDCNNAGFSGGLTIGDYNLAKLQALGVSDDDISSIKITQGYKAILYQDDNFSGASIEITADNACLNSTWNDKVTSVRILANGVTNLAGTYHLQNRNSALFMDVWGNSSADGANVSQGNFNGSTNQQFKFTHLGDGVYQVLAVHSGKSLDIDAIKTTDGANVQQWTYFGSGNQQFIVVATGDGYYKLIAKHSGKLIEVASAGLANGDNIQQWTNANQTCGQWRFKPTNETIGSGNGLRGNYFNGQNFETPVYTSLDAKIDFNWGNGSPNALVNNDSFTARWTGQVQAKSTGDYTFYINSDNGRRLWVNNQLIIDKWLDDHGIDYSGNITLTAGQKYEIKIEYFENVGGADVQLAWSTNILPKEVIPTTQLYANTLPTVSIVTPTNNQTFTAPASINITTNAADTDGSVAKVEFYNGTTLLNSDASAPFIFTWANSTQGSYPITARVFDNRNAVAVSSVVTVIVNPTTTDVVDNITSETVSVYPNPTSDILTIEVPAAWGNVQVSIVDITGKEVYQESNFISGKIATKDFAAGIYAISIKSNEKVFRQKIVKQ